MAEEWNLELPEDRLHELVEDKAKELLERYIDGNRAIKALSRLNENTYHLPDDKLMEWASEGFSQANTSAPIVGRIKAVPLTVMHVEEDLYSRLWNIRWNVLTHDFVVDATEITPRGERSLNFDDAVTRMMSDFKSSGMYSGVNRGDLTDYLTFIGRQNQFNPVLDLLKRGDKWDGHDRIPDLYDLLNIGGDPLSQTLVKLWLYQAIAMLYNSDTEPLRPEGVLVLLGKQNQRKSTFVEHLALNDMGLDFYGELPIKVDDRDAMRRITGHWIVEIGEIDQLRFQEVEAVRQFLTLTKDSFRAPYARSDTVSPRRTSFIATANSKDYLRDVTGNRRFWTVELDDKGIDYQSICDFDFLQLWKQIFSEVDAMSYKQRGECFRLTGFDLDALNLRNTKYRRPIDAETEVQDILALAKKKGCEFKLMTITDFKKYWNDEIGRYSGKAIGAALTAAGVEQDKTTGGARVRMLPVNPNP